MPRTPGFSRFAGRIRTSTFELFGARLEELAARGELIPLHIGDTYLLPPAAARRIDLEAADVYRLGAAEGREALRQAIERRLGEVYGFPTGDLEVLVVPGGTAGVSLASEAVFDPGDEVLVVTPTWPVVFGILDRRGAEIREVKVGADGWPEEDAAAFRRRLREAVTPRTAGLYVCDPDNPSGFVYPRSYVEEIAALALEEDLWVIADIAYADLIFKQQRPYFPPAADPRLGERCIAVGSFTKPYGLAGLRVGYLAVPKALAEVVVRLQTHTMLHASMAGQAMALACLETEADHTIADSYRRGAALVEEHLSLRFRAPEAGSFVFLDLRPLGIETREQTLEFLSRCLDQGVCLCPGELCGAEFEAFARLCFTCVPPEILTEALQRINRVAEGWSGA